ncbi:MAG TPA: flavin reductase family protein [Thermomicrobiales bacterium]|nr:flavin reductase family protein [Thermomicrobiales bacterium]
MSGSGAIDPAAYRRALGLFATGVTVITVQREDIMHGMTANAFSALSLDPPLVLFCVGKGARMAKYLDGAEGFAVNILSADQERISAQFAGYDKDSDRLVEALTRGPIAPLIPGTLVSLSCTLEARHEGGDHWIIVGRVIEIHEPEGGNPRPPLLFFRSRYGTLIERGEPLPDQVVWSNDAIRIYHDEWSVDADEVPEEDHVRAHIWN